MYVSGGAGGSAMVNDRVPVAVSGGTALSVTVTETEEPGAVGAVGVPEMTPADDDSDKPGGSALFAATAHV